ncbi:uncharacterized protein LOC131891828 [Tigriopus californicus]|uniref:uncharacterized protein LOC131891828 n=1 Tax=Tigriopus californicus TaxID=6832 RepID=UPI0027DA9B51|nr:uncharacterized protein LOC131891828 [Tigriopus californicus]
MCRFYEMMVRETQKFASFRFQMKERTVRRDQCKRFWKNTTQGIFLILCLGWFFLKMYQSYNELISQHVGTQVQLVGNREVDPPAITICRPSTLTYSAKALKAHGLYVGKEETIEGMERVEENNELMRDVLESAWIPHDELNNGFALFDEVAFINYGYYGDKAIWINSSLTSENSPFVYWHSILHPYYGQCQSLIVKKDILADLRSSLSLIQIHFMQDIMEASIPSWLIFLHTPNAFGHQMEVLRIFTGRLYEFDVEPKIIKHVSRVNKPCNDEIDYKMEECLFQCLEVEYIKKYGCRSPKIAITGNASQGVLDCTSKDYRNIYPDINSDEMVLGLSELVAEIQVEDFQRDVCKCLPPCEQHSVTSGVNKDENLFESLDIGASTVNLKMPNTVHVYSEYVTYSELQFTSDFGGFLGLFMGLSLYSLHDFINIFIDFGIDMIPH